MIGMKLLVGGVPIVGAVIGLDKVSSLGKRINDLNQDSVLKVIRQYSECVAWNTFAWGSAALISSFYMNSPMLFTLGAAQLFVCIDQFRVLEQTVAN